MGFVRWSDRGFIRWSDICFARRIDVGIPGRREYFCGIGVRSGLSRSSLRLLGACFRIHRTGFFALVIAFHSRFLGRFVRGLRGGPIGRSTRRRLGRAPVLVLTQVSDLLVLGDDSFGVASTAPPYLADGDKHLCPPRLALALGDRLAEGVTQEGTPETH